MDTTCQDSLQCNRTHLELHSYAEKLLKMDIDPIVVTVGLVPAPSKYVTGGEETSLFGHVRGGGVGQRGALFSKMRLFLLPNSKEASVHLRKFVQRVFGGASVGIKAST